VQNAGRGVQVLERGKTLLERCLGQPPQSLVGAGDYLDSGGLIPTLHSVNKLAGLLTVHGG
jgi:hypothetical protein